MSKAHPDDSKTDEQIRISKEWKKQPESYKAYTRGTSVKRTQEFLRLGNTSDMKDIPTHPSDLEREAANNLFAPSEELLESSETYAFTRAANKTNRPRDILNAIGYKKEVNTILKIKGINPYEWEVYPNFIFTTTPKEERDYLENGQDLFPRE